MTIHRYCFWTFWTLFTLSLILFLNVGIDSYNKNRRKSILSFIAATIIPISFTGLYIYWTRYEFTRQDPFNVLLLFLIIPYLVIVTYTCILAVQNFDSNEPISNNFKYIIVATIIIVLTAAYTFSIMLLCFLLYPLLLLMIYYILITIKEYHSGVDRKAILKNVGVMIVILIVFITSIYVPFEYISTPNANQKFTLKLEQNQTSNIVLRVPNLKSREGEYFPVENFKIIEGQCSVEPYKESEYIKINTSSTKLHLEYSEEAKMFSGYDGRWRFPDDKILKEDGEYFVNIYYSSNQNITCRLYLYWEDNYSPKIMGGSWERLKVNSYIKEQTELVKVSEYSQEVV